MEVPMLSRRAVSLAMAMASGKEKVRLRKRQADDSTPQTKALSFFIFARRTSCEHFDTHAQLLGAGNGLCSVMARRVQHGNQTQIA